MRRLSSRPRPTARLSSMIFCRARSLESCRSASGLTVWRLGSCNGVCACSDPVVRSKAIMKEKQTSKSSPPGRQGIGQRADDLSANTANHVHEHLSETEAFNQAPSFASHPVRIHAPDGTCRRWRTSVTGFPAALRRSRLPIGSMLSCASPGHSPFGQPKHSGIPRPST
jgi:hypothetical protein